MSPKTKDAAEALLRNENDDVFEEVDHESPGGENEHNDRTTWKAIALTTSRVLLKVKKQPFITLRGEEVEWLRSDKQLEDLHINRQKPIQITREGQQWEAYAVVLCPPTIHEERVAAIQAVMNLYYQTFLCRNAVGGITGLVQKTISECPFFVLDDYGFKPSPFQHEPQYLWNQTNSQYNSLLMSDMERDALTAISQKEPEPEVRCKGCIIIITH